MPNPHHYQRTLSPLLPLATGARQILLPRPFLAGPSRPFPSPLPRQYTVLARDTRGAAALASPLRPSTGSPLHTLAPWRPRMASHRKVSLRRHPALGPSSACLYYNSLLLPTSLLLDAGILVRLYDASSQRKMLEISTSAQVPAEKHGAMYFYEVPRLTLPRKFRGILAVSGKLLRRVHSCAIPFDRRSPMTRTPATR